MILVSDGDIANPNNKDILAIDNGRDEITVMTWADWLVTKSYLEDDFEYDTFELDPDL